jgi:DNA-binding GntR family transcriptional regulator
MSIIDTRSLSDHIYLRIRTMILEGNFEPGQKIEKQALARELGVSQTPINDALNRLSGEKYLEQRSRQGYFVRAYTPQDMKEMFEVRAGLEGMAVRLCIERAPDDLLESLCRLFDGYDLPLAGQSLRAYTLADQQFHQTIIACSGNEMIRNMNESFGYLMKSYQRGLARPPDETLPEHRAIIEAIRTKNGLLAQDLMVRHHTRSAAIWTRRNGKEENQVPFEG